MNNVKYSEEYVNMVKEIGMTPEDFEIYMESAKSVKHNVPNVINRWCKVELNKKVKGNLYPMDDLLDIIDELKTINEKMESIRGEPAVDFMDISNDTSGLNKIDNAKLKQKECIRRFERLRGWFKSIWEKIIE